GADRQRHRLPGRQRAHAPAGLTFPVADPARRLIAGGRAGFFVAVAEAADDAARPLPHRARSGSACRGNRRAAGGQARGAPEFGRDGARRADGRADRRAASGKQTDARRAAPAPAGRQVRLMVARTLVGAGEPPGGSTLMPNVVEESMSWTTARVDGVTWAGSIIPTDVGGWSDPRSHNW